LTHTQQAQSQLGDDQAEDDTRQYQRDRAFEAFEKMRERFFHWSIISIRSFPDRTNSHDSNKVHFITLRDSEVATISSDRPL